MIIKNCKILVDGKLKKVNIQINGSRIGKIMSDEIIDASDGEIIDLKGKIVLPGLIDPHVHFREPGLVNKEDFLSGSLAAAKGGITTVLDMPNTVPPTLTVKLLDDKRKLASKSVVNYGFHFGSSKNNLPEIKKVKGVASVKIFMDLTTGDMKIDDKAVLDVMRNSKVVTVHAEGENVKKAVSLINKTKNHLYLCHISTKQEIDYLRKNKASNVSVEVTPHHLFLTTKDEKRLKAYGKMKPGLKSHEDQEALWQAIKEGIVDTVGTDHAPHTIEEKEKNGPYGVPGVETMLPLLLDAVNKKRLSLADVQRLCCENPASIFGIKGKGHIKEGYDADLTVVDMNKIEKVVSDKLLTKSGWSQFEGKLLKGWPVMTIVNGNIVYDNGLVLDIKAKEVKYGIS
ncbi:MAG: amidohydrolase family protein [Nanoarchaeota archaeon]|nr:amidohydrolase family protein [Nanoarchaeota archaeon]